MWNVENLKKALHYIQKVAIALAKGRRMRWITFPRTEQNFLIEGANSRELDSLATVVIETAQRVSFRFIRQPHKCRSLLPNQPSQVRPKLRGHVV